MEQNKFQQSRVETTRLTSCSGARSVPLDAVNGMWLHFSCHLHFILWCSSQFFVLVQCKARYDVHWRRAPGRCPNLVPSWQDKKNNKFGGIETFRVTVHENVLNTTLFTDVYESLADLWSSWYQAYLDADYPRLIIRYEDTLFHAEQVVQQVVSCAGLAPTMSSVRSASSDAAFLQSGMSSTRTSDPREYHRRLFRYRVERGKDHGNSSDFVSAILKYGKKDGRYQGMVPRDLRYAKERGLSSSLMETFHYVL
jgi:hypothetical protein